MSGAMLMFCVREDLTDCLQLTRTFFAYDQLHTFKTTPFQPLQEVDPTGLFPFYTLGSAWNFAIPTLITAIATSMATFSYFPPQPQRRKMPSSYTYRYFHHPTADGSGNPLCRRIPFSSTR